MKTFTFYVFLLIYYLKQTPVSSSTCIVIACKKSGGLVCGHCSSHFGQISYKNFGHAYKTLIKLKNIKNSSFIAPTRLYEYTDEKIAQIRPSRYVYQAVS